MIGIHPEDDFEKKSSVHDCCIMIVREEMAVMMIRRVVYVDDDDDDSLKLIVPEGDGGWRIRGLVPDIGHHPHGLA